MWPPTGLIPWFSKTKGNTYATIVASPFPLQGKPTQAQAVARSTSGAVAGESTQKSAYQVPITNPYLPHYIIRHLPLIFLSPTSPLPFYLPSLSQSPPLFFACLLVGERSRNSKFSTHHQDQSMEILAMRERGVHLHTLENC